MLPIAHKGKTAHLIKPSSHRKRTIHDMEGVKEEEKQLMSNKQKYFEQSKQMKTDIHNKENIIKELRSYENLVHHLHDEGVIGPNGEILNERDKEDFMKMR